MTRTPKRTPKTRVADLIKETDPSLKGLPLVHTTDAYRFSDVLSSQVLAPTLCAVFEEPLLYLFLGRPAYRTRKGANDNLTFDLPVAIILRPTATIPTPRRVMPFDSGAYEKGLYRTNFHQETILEDFLLPPTIDASISYISHFYTNIREYYNGSTRKNVEIAFDSFEAKGLLELARAVPDPAADFKNSS